MLGASGDDGVLCQRVSCIMFRGVCVLSCLTCPPTMNKHHTLLLNGETCSDKPSHNSNANILIIRSEYTVKFHSHNFTLNCKFSDYLFCSAGSEQEHPIDKLWHITVLATNLKLAMKVLNFSKSLCSNFV